MYDPSLHSNPLASGEYDPRFARIRFLRKFVRALVFLTVLLLWGLPKQAFAYLDPGTGSYIIQIVIASLAGGAYLIAIFRERIKTFLSDLISKLFKRQKDEEGK